MPKTQCLWSKMFCPNITIFTTKYMIDLFQVPTKSTKCTRLSEVSLFSQNIKSCLVVSCVSKVYCLYFTGFVLKSSIQVRYYSVQLKPVQFEFNYSIILCKINLGKKCFVSPFMLLIVARKYNFNTVTCNYVKYDNGLSSWSFHQLLFVVSVSSFTIVEIIQWYFKKNKKKTPSFLLLLTAKARG